MYNKKQRLGLLLLLVIIVILQLAIYSIGKISQSTELVFQDSLTKKLNAKTIVYKYPEKNPVKYFRFNPNKLEYSYWKYFSLTNKQLYKLDSFRAVETFDNYNQLKRVLEFSSYQDSVFSKYVYFEIRQKENRSWKKEEKKELFEFNPNNIEKKDWIKLGFSNKQSEVIVNYIKKYGPLESKEDLGEIYVIDSFRLKKMWSYIKLPERVAEKTYERDLNKCNEKDLMTLCGLDLNSAREVIKYRKRLGGFCFSYQLKELKVLNDEIIDTINSQFYINRNFKAGKININTASFDELAAHPYMKKSLAMSICNFRENFRDFKSVDELKNIESLSEAYFDKIALYLSAD